MCVRYLTGQPAQLGANRAKCEISWNFIRLYMLDIDGILKIVPSDIAHTLDQGRGKTSMAKQTKRWYKCFLERSVSCQLVSFWMACSDEA